MNINDLTPEQRARALECKTPADLAALAKEYGVDLTDEQLEAISGGADWNECEEDVCSDRDWRQW